MQDKIETLQKLLEEIAKAAEIVDRITITIKPKDLIKEEKTKEQ